MEQKLSIGGRVQLNRFCRQYLQLQLELDYPAEEYLRKDAFQEAIYYTVFDESVIEHPPPPRYQLKVLKELVKRIEQSIQDWEEDGISDNLMNHLSTLLSSPLPSEAASTQQKSYVTYTLSSLLPSFSNIKSLLPTSPRSPEITPPTTPTSTSSTLVPPTITLLESRNLLSASGTTGLKTWEASLHLSQYLISLSLSLSHSNSQPLIPSKRILELGSGTGFLSILCSKYLGAEYVLCTDGSSDVVSCLSDNFALNSLNESSKIDGGVYIWGEDEDPVLDGGKGRGETGMRMLDEDVVIAADVTYDAAGIPALVSTFQNVFARNPAVKVLVAATVRNERTFKGFLGTCEGCGLRVEEIEFPVVGGRQQEGPFYDDGVEIKICEVKLGGRC
ncbi:Protein-lysine N-methyltransferase EFM3 [Lachnellula cervina]|uniref:Protein-lysine N-methyltransferase EFM3 n=1 Tax=Lachnellula cervina TaxID=1316786 RepID=A0A7D8YY64_9HELO|nr:Protein-lysine N-methyltransferase EFM3 [Lachnellula cervina]